MNNISSLIIRKNKRYNFRNLVVIDYTEKVNYNANIGNNRKRKLDNDNNLDNNKESKKIRKITNELNYNDKQDMWYEFNTIDKFYGQSDDTRSWVSATAVKNYLLNDPLLDWLNLYYIDYGFNNKLDNQGSKESEGNHEKNKRKIEFDKSSHSSILFEMGNKFEDEVIKYLKNKYPDCVKSVISKNNSNQHISPELMNLTFQLMLEGIPIITHAVLYNYLNKTFGVADLLVRSDWLNKIIHSIVIPIYKKNIKAPKLHGNFHYCVIDIKWTTLHLCANGEFIRNDNLFAAYKGQITIYNAALGILQGYTPNRAYILAKAWKYEEKNYTNMGYNCFDLLGHIDFSTFDRKYISQTKNAIDWVRNVRYNGYKWSCIPPSVPELYPNMCNNYDFPYHQIKQNLADILHELTQIWKVSVRNRKIAHSNGVFKWSDPLCTPQIMGIRGKKISPIITQILKVNNINSDVLIEPKIIKNNTYDWKNKKDIDFYVDFESINSCFYNRTINLENSKEENGIIFLIGIGYEENNQWKYKSFSMNQFNLEEEKRIMIEFIDFIENKTNEYVSKNKIKHRNLCFPTIFHWGHAEQTMFHIANKRHGNIWDNWIKYVNWLDFCTVFQEEPIIIKGVKKFGLKEIAKIMNKHKFIQTQWKEGNPESGLSVMSDAANYYRYHDNYLKMDNETQLKEIDNYLKYLKQFLNIIDYNEIDCKVIWEIVRYLRNNHC